METNYVSQHNAQDTLAGKKDKPLIGGHPAPWGPSSVGASQPAMGSPGSLGPGSSGSGSGDTSMEESIGPITIAVVGKTKSGKTSFINAVTGMSFAIEHGLDPCTLPSSPGKDEGN